MMHPAEPDARPQSTLWMLDLGQPLKAGEAYIWNCASLPVYRRCEPYAEAGQ